MLLHLKHMVDTYNLVIMTMLEKQVPNSRAKIIMDNSKFTNLVVEEAHGFAGGIWMFWDAHRVDMEVISAWEQIMTIEVRFGSGSLWLLFVVYASPKWQLREEWDYIKQLGSKVDIPRCGILTKLLKLRINLGYCL